MGSRREARHAGTRHAITATASSVITTEPITTGSSGFVPKSIDVKMRVVAIPAASPTARPTQGRLQSIKQHEPQHLFALRAEGDADAELGGALRHEVGEHAVEADRGEQEREHGKGEDHGGGKAGVAEGVADDLVDGEHVGYGQLGIEGSDLLLDGNGEGERIGGGVDGEGTRSQLPSRTGKYIMGLTG